MHKTVNRELRFCVIYLIVTMIVFMIGNLLEYYYLSKFKIIDVLVEFFVAIIYFIPLFYCNIKCKWNRFNLGFNFNVKSIIITIMLLCVFLYKLGDLRYKNSFTFSINEGILRCGEEFYFRGFIYFLILKIYENYPSKNSKAMIISSVLFTLGHSTIFIGVYPLDIFSMFISTFLAFATLRYYTKSLLPEIAMHTYLNGGFISALVGIVFFTIICSLLKYYDKK